MTMSGLRRTPVLVLLLVVLTACGGQDDDHRAGTRTSRQGPAAVVAPQGPRQCLRPGQYLYFQLVHVRQPARLSYVRSAAPQTDLARPRGVEARRIWVKPKPARFRATQGTRPWPYGMGRAVSMMTGWEDSWDPLPLPDEDPRYLPVGWSYVFVLVEGRHASRADIRIGWESRSRHQGELAMGRGVWFNKRCR